MSHRLPIFGRTIGLATIRPPADSYTFDSTGDQAAIALVADGYREVPESCAYAELLDPNGNVIQAWRGNGA